MTSPDDAASHEATERGDDGIKKLSSDNWLEGDDILRAFVRLDATGKQSALTKEVLAERFLSIELPPEVPSEIQTLYRTARGVLLYGYFFYPLYVVGLGEISRTAEAAVIRRFRDLGGPRKAARSPRASSGCTKPATSPARRSSSGTRSGATGTRRRTRATRWFNRLPI